MLNMRSLPLPLLQAAANLSGEFYLRPCSLTAASAVRWRLVFAMATRRCAVTQGQMPALAVLLLGLLVMISTNALSGHGLLHQGHLLFGVLVLLDCRGAVVFSWPPAPGDHSALWALSWGCCTPPPRAGFPCRPEDCTSRSRAFTTLYMTQNNYTQHTDGGPSRRRRYCGVNWPLSCGASRGAGVAILVCQGIWRWRAVGRVMSCLAAYIRSCWGCRYGAG